MHLLRVQICEFVSPVLQLNVRTAQYMGVAPDDAKKNLDPRSHARMCSSSTTNG